MRNNALIRIFALVAMLVSGRTLAAPISIDLSFTVTSQSSDFVSEWGTNIPIGSTVSVSVEVDSGDLLAAIALSGSPYVATGSATGGSSGQYTLAISEFGGLVGSYSGATTDGSLIAFRGTGSGFTSGAGQYELFGLGLVLPADLTTLNDLLALNSTDMNSFLGQLNAVSLGDELLYLSLERNNLQSVYALGATYAAFAITQVPEPATLTLVGLGLAGIGAMRRKQLAA